MLVNVIIGGGISGLLALNIIPDSMLLESSGELAKDLYDMTFPKYVHDTTEIAEFAKGLKREKFDIMIMNEGYFMNFFNNTRKEQQFQIFQAYRLKKYGQSLIPVSLDKMNGYLSGKRANKFIADKEGLVKNLCTQGLRIETNNEVSLIDLENKSLKANGTTYFYDNLISTIPISTFSKLSGLHLDIRFITIPVIRVSIESKFDICKHFIYSVDFSYHFHRINVNESMNELVFEMDTKHQDDVRTCLDFLVDYKIKYGAINKQTYKFPVVDKFPILDNTYFLGRLAEGNYSIKIEDVIKHARQITTDIQHTKKD